MSDYNRDAALDQLAEWEEEERAIECVIRSVTEDTTHILKDDSAKRGVQKNMEAEGEAMLEYYNECDIHAYSEGRLCEARSPEEYDMVFVPLVPKLAWPENNPVKTEECEGDLQSPEEFVGVSEEIIQQKIIKDTEDQIRELMRQNIPINVDMCVNIRNKSKEKFKKTNKLDITFCELPNVFG